MKIIIPTGKKDDLMLPIWFQATVEESDTTKFSLVNGTTTLIESDNLRDFERLIKRFRLR